MPTKQELLEEKTVKELTQMARDKDLSGYSRMNKGELIELIKSNYKKAEIEAWPESEEEEPKEEKPVEKEKEKPEKEVEEEIIGPETAEIDKSEFKTPKKVETVEVEGDFERVSRPQTMKKEEEPRWFLIGAVIVIIIIAAILIAWAAI